MNSDLLLAKEHCVQHSQSQHSELSQPLDWSQKKIRIHSIDMMRGLVMLIMLLDHVRERVLLHLQVSDPMDLSTTTSGLFFSRFAAHFCAPIFVFLTGLSAWLYQQQPSSNQGSVQEFLLKRGVFLIVLEITLVNFAWMGHYQTLWLQVIWVIGLSMIALACCLSLPKPVMAMVGVALVAGHNLLTPITFQPEQLGYSLWTVLHDRNYLMGPETAFAQDWFKVKISYPVLPWIGVIILGYLAGPLFSHADSTEARQRALYRIGLLCLALFALLRGANLYGETLPWQWQDTALLTVMDVLNLTKYPPSLHFLLLTLGVMLCLLAWFERPIHWRYRTLLTSFGAAPMFFYLLHLYALLLLYRILLAWFGPNQGELFGVNSMTEVWLITFAMAALLYWPTRWFADYKRRSRSQWIRYL